MGALGFVLCVVVPLIALVVLVILRGINASSREEAISRARNDYQKALAKLKSDPTNADLKQQALNFGRAYSNAARDSKGVTIFDEMALSNDLAAATAGATPAATPAAPAKPSAAERLRQLDELRGQGLVSQAEYDERRRAILSEV